MKPKQLLLSAIALLLSTTAWANVGINETNFPDAYFRNWVLRQDYGKDGVLTDEEIAGVTKISAGSRNLQSLKGIEFFTALTSLDCSRNLLTSLDLSKNTALKELICYANNLTSLDVSECTALTSIQCYGNQLTSLDVSKNTALTTLDCRYNQLTALDVSKNNTLTMLGCSSNKLTELNVSKNTALMALLCDENQLIALDVSKNTVLNNLDCHNNNLTSLDVSGCTVLASIQCSRNQLTELNLSKNTALKQVDCYYNQIKGAAMDELVESLPTVSWGIMKVIGRVIEQNVMTTLQVAAAKVKGWLLFYYDGDEWKIYAGSDPNGITPTPNFSRHEEVCYDLSGHRVKKVKKGVYVIGGKKIAVK